MKILLLRLLMITSKYGLRLFLIQVICMNLVIARPSHSQDLDRVTVSFSVDQASITEILREIEHKTEFVFAYTESVQDVDKHFTLRYKDISLRKVLEELSLQGGLQFKRINNTISVVHSAEKHYAPVLPVEITITGTVTEKDGLPLPGVNVVLKGTTTGTTTDMDGKYSLILADEHVNSTLVFSFIGYAPKEIPIGGRSVINVQLEEDVQTLEEVVVVGYGAQQKATVVGSIVQIGDKELKRTGNVTDLTQALVGQLPGLVSLTSSGEPGGVGTGESGTNLFIRGQNTWNGGQPLILVDGVERNMNNIDVNEVASISVLKDASATAVYGVRGANGVILITTKRGTEGKTVLNFNYTSTAIMLSKQPDKLDSYAAMMAKNEMIEREGVLNEPSWNAYVPHEIVQRYRLPQSAEYKPIYPNVDWEDEMFKETGFAHRATLSARGGSKAVQYYGLLAYTHEGDLFKDYDNIKGYKPNYDFDRFNFRSNMDVRLTRTTKLKINLSGYFSQKNTNWNNEGSTGRADWWMWAATYYMAPNLFIPMHEDGRWGAYQEGGNNTLNPLAVVYNIGVRETRSTQLNSDFVIEQNLGFITKGLKASGNLFYDNSVRSQGGIWDTQNSVRPNEARTNVPYKQIYPNLYQGPEQDPSEYTLLLPISDEEYDWVLQPWTVRQEAIIAANWDNTIPVVRRLTYQGQLNYARKFGAHNVGAMGVFRREEYARGSMFKNFREDWVFRATYDYDTRYLLEVNGAYNGSEQFGPAYRFDFFPSVAAGWYISNEKFFNVDWLDILKVRYSIGKVGDDKVSGSRWLYQSQLRFGGRSRLSESTSGYSPYYFYRESVVGNPEIHWENAIKTNLGVEMGFFEDAITVNFDYFTEDRTDILMSGGSRTVPPFFGATPPSANLGHVKSKGFEIELGFNKRISNFDVWATLALTHNENKVISRDDPPLQLSHLKSAGYPIGQHKRILKTEFYDNWDEVYASIPTETNDLQKLPGYYDLIDFNADGVIKASEDAAPVGYSTVPQNTGNLSIGANYKGLSFMVQFFGVNNANRYIAFNNFRNNIDIVFGHVADYWSEENTDATSFLPRWQTQAENVGHYYLYDASYLRLRIAEVGYSLNSSWMKRAGISNLRLFLNGNNLFFWSNLPDDRETTHSGASDTQGAYPTTKRVNLGIDLTF
jgi:TonB-linked SusC/RagA family outer membrane protein